MLVYLCLSACVGLSVFVYVFLSLFTLLCLSTCVYIPVVVYPYLSTYSCLHVLVYLCLTTCVCIPMFVYLCLSVNVVYLCTLLSKVSEIVQQIMLILK